MLQYLPKLFYSDLHEGKDTKRREKRMAAPGSAASDNGPKLSPLGFTGAYDSVASAGLLSNCSSVSTRLV